MKKKGKEKKGVMAVKLDMAKAYDRVEWSFVEGVLKAMVFSENLVATIMGCISTVFYQVMLNGQSGQRFFPERGISCSLCRCSIELIEKRSFSWKLIQNPSG